MADRDRADYDKVPLEAETDLGVESPSLKQTSLEPLEFDSGLDRDEEVPTLRWVTDPWLPSIAVTLILVVPILVTFIVLINDLIGRIWPASLFAIHLTVSSWVAFRIAKAETSPSVRQRLLYSLTEILLFCFIYSTVCDAFIWGFFTDVDGTPVVEYEDDRNRFVRVRSVGYGVAFLRFVVEGTALYLTWRNRNLQLPRSCGTAWARMEQRGLCTSQRQHQLRKWLRMLLQCLVAASIIVLVWCLVSMLAHLISWPAPAQHGPQCDPLDATECALPFPSFHHMVKDNTTETGWRVALDGNALPPLKGGTRLHPAFLNELDGFSTMAPMLFYMEGLKEAHETMGTSNEVRLQGANHIELSVTNRSITLLLNVDAQTLVPHTAEIDYLDKKRPLVMVFPASPLSHNTHYAVAVVRATNVHGQLLPPTPGMQFLFSSGRNDYSGRWDRYTRVVIPALERAAPWFSHDREPESLQLLFDFQTISAKSQLGPVRAVRDATLSYIDGAEFGGDWSNHVRAIRIDDGNCRTSRIARTVHAEMDVPWFLDAFGSGHREAILDRNAVSSGTPTTIGKAKFVVHIPCSLRSAALNGTPNKGLRAVMEYGHGLFFNRDEATDGFLVEMADKNGYIITAMDWRGMSSFDLLMVVKVLMSKPKVFQAVRDNLIQGYANKLALQHFTRHGLLQTDWLQFGAGTNPKHPVPFYQGLQPSFVFYGISQGGILGAGYSALSGPTQLIDRTILGVPGTPFALIMTRSLDFAGYDLILLLNFYNNRHVRILLSLVQMAWDSVEGSGLLAPPLTEPHPPTLLQAGLGDSVVPTIACEALARALGASTLPNSPREIFGIQIADFLNVATNGTDSPAPAVLTELKYREEYASLPVDDKKEPHNDVHLCVRRDPNLIQQIAEFVNTGRIVDACEEDGCLRQRVLCGIAK